MTSCDIKSYIMMSCVMTSCVMTSCVMIDARCMMRDVWFMINDASCIMHILNLFMLLTAWKSDPKHLRFQNWGTDTKGGTYTGWGRLVLIYSMSKPSLPFTAPNSALKQLRYGLLWKLVTNTTHRNSSNYNIDSKFVIPPWKAYLGDCPKFNHIFRDAC